MTVARHLNGHSATVAAGVAGQSTSSYTPDAALAHCENVRAGSVGNDFAPLASLSSIPPEVLNQILAACSPRDLAALSQTCKYLNVYLREATHVWSRVYCDIWDVPQLLNGQHVQHDALSSVQIPQAVRDGGADRGGKQRSTYMYGRPLKYLDESPKGKGKTMERFFLEEHIYPQTQQHFDARKETQKRIWAEQRIKQLDSRPFETLTSYNTLMQTLLNVARTRSKRVESETDSEEKTSIYLEKLFGNSDEKSVFERLIYPRSDITRLREWQRSQEQKAFTDDRLTKAEEKRTRSLSNASRTSMKRARGRRATNEADRANSSRRRRSARLLLGAYPSELHHLLTDEKGNVCLDENGEVLRLEEIEAIDEQLAAELHVLHGILPRRTCKTRAGSPDGEATYIEGVNDTEEAIIEDGGMMESDDETNRAILQFGSRFLRRTVPEAPLASKLTGISDTELRGRARNTVYDTGRYGPENDYGPFRAWRSRILAIDGPREDLYDDGDESDEDDEDGDDQMTTGRDPEPRLDGELEGPEALLARSMSPEVPTGDDPPIVDLTQMPEDEITDDDDDDDEDFDPDDPDFDANAVLDELHLGVREMSTRMCRGLLPWLEADRVQAAHERHKFPVAAKVHRVAIEDHDAEEVWCTDKRVDWVIVEAVMVLMFCNIRRGTTEGWGRSIRLPGDVSSVTGRDSFARRALEDLRWTSWRDVIGLPCGWNHSRGQNKESKQNKEGDSKGRLKPYDWANVESTWIGTYAFLDWGTWAYYNSIDPKLRGYPDEGAIPDPTRPLIRDGRDEISSLEHEHEVVGDCLQLRLRLLPLGEQRPKDDRDRVLSTLNGDDSTCWTDDGALLEGHFPPLRFRGDSYTVQDDGGESIRGCVHGIVRPVYAPKCPDYDEKRDGPRAIVAAHWELTHRYDGEDRWSLSGVQAGPPGSRAPIYGIWGTAERRDNTSPCGPFAYYMLDERPWQVVQDLLIKEQRRAR